MKIRRLLALWSWLVAACFLQAEEKQGGGWSADLLSEILKADTPASTARPAEAEAPAAAAQDGEMLLRTYRFSHIKVGEAGQAHTMLRGLQHLLPAGSSMNPDVPQNSIHVLTTEPAHRVFHEIITALDVPPAKSPLAAPAIPAEMQGMLTKLAQTADDTGRLAAAVGSLNTDIGNRIAEIDARQRSHTTKLVLGGVALAVVLALVITLLMRRKPQADPSTAVAVPTSTSLVLQPEQLTTALMPVQDRVRNDMLGMLNEVAIKLQAQHNDQQRLMQEQRLQLEEARRAMAQESSKMSQAVDRVDVTTQKLALQQDKVAELVDELQGTINQLDHTRDELDRTREELTKAKIDVEHERAKIAALSIMLDEGALPPPTNLDAIFPETPSDDSRPNGSTDTGVSPESTFTPSFQPPCNQEATAPTRQDQTSTAVAPRFTFLPPDHPEN